MPKGCGVLEDVGFQPLERGGIAPTLAKGLPNALAAPPEEPENPGGEQRRKDQ